MATATTAATFTAAAVSPPCSVLVVLHFHRHALICTM
jgi:hypothetical protein